ncbi:MAG: T9SS type A sorting domain-containing protein [Chitinophagaceae bacterium]
MNRFLLGAVFIFSGMYGKGQMARWTFEGVTTANTGVSPVFSVGTDQADAGSQTAGSFFTAVHTDGATVWSNPVGNGSSKSVATSRWGTGDYYQVFLNASGFQDLTVSWDATGSSTGPRDFKVQYSTDNITYTDAAGLNSTYQLTEETWSSATNDPVSARTLDLSYLSVLNNSSAVYLRFAVTSNTSIAGGTVATGGTSRIDNITVSGIAIPANTITLTGISATTFNLADCFATASGTADFSSTGNFAAGNTFTAQLSDAAGSFLTPANVGSLAVSGTDPAGTISFTIPNGTANGAAYRIRVVASSPVTYSNLTAAITINQAGNCVSSPADYFRSKATGAWSATSTWESSPTGGAGTWIPATLTPASAAGTITIRNLHTVTVNTAVTVDQLVIATGGTLVNSAGLITVSDDASGHDIQVQNGGTLVLSFTNNPPVFSPSTATAEIQTGGRLKVTAGGMTGAGTGVNATNFIYRDASILELTTAFSTAGVTYFPNVTTEIPIFRTVGILSVGAGTNTVINGVLEVNNNITFLNAGTKTFRNGIRGSGDVNGSTSGTFIINGATAELGGTGALTTPATGLQIGSASGTTVTLSSHKTITGDISLAGTNTFVDLGIYNLTVTGTLSGGGPNAYIRTHGAGSLVLNSVGAGGKVFPVGYTSYNPVTITNGSNQHYTVRVENGIVPGIAFPTNGINRTWTISAGSTTPGVTVAFQYRGADANTGAAPQPLPMEILMYAGVAWNLLPGQTNITPGGADPYTVTSAATMTINNIATPYALGKSGGYVLPLDYFISARAQKQNNNGFISWEVYCTGEVTGFEVQRSGGGLDFRTIAVMAPVSNTLTYYYTDVNLGTGTFLYRVKVNRRTGGSRYSNVVALVNGTDGLLITGIAPDPVQHQAAITISMAKKGTVNFEIYSLAGRKVRNWVSALPEGNSVISLSMSGLPAGLYHIVARNPDASAVYRFIKQ